MANITTTTEDGKTRPAFDLGMLGHYWWDFEDDWLPNGEVPRVHNMAHYGGTGSPDNHDTDGTIAGNAVDDCQGRPNCDEAVANISVRDYAVAALTSNSVYMQMGYEYCKETHNHVFKDSQSREDWDRLSSERSDENHPLNIGSRIREINELKDSLNIEHCYASFRDYGTSSSDGQLIKIHCEYHDVDSDEKIADIVLFINKRPEEGGIKIPRSSIENIHPGGLEIGWNAGDELVINDILIMHTPVDREPGIDNISSPKNSDNGPELRP